MSNTVSQSFNHTVPFFVSALLLSDKNFLIALAQMLQSVTMHPHSCYVHLLMRIIDSIIKKNFSIES